ncbi:MAG: NfeD family protein [Bacteroidales bacterium]|nr:NfeD family protein [Bacteroidales bacterium]
MNMLLFAWEQLPLMGKIYWILAVPSTAIFLILLVLSFFGADADADIDGGDIGDVDIGEGLGGFILSFKSIISFVMMFGWAGIISMTFDLSIALTIIVAVITGLVSLIAVASLLYFITKMSYSGTMNLENSIGKVGSVILRIPSKKQGIGQIQVNVQGSLRTLEAMTEEKEQIKSGTNVQVIDVQDNILIVIPKI